MNYFYEVMKSVNDVITNKYVFDDVYKCWRDLFNIPIGVLEIIPETQIILIGGY